LEQGKGDGLAAADTRLGVVGDAGDDAYDDDGNYEKVTKWLAAANTTGHEKACTHQEDRNDKPPNVYRTRGGKDSEITPSEDLLSVSQKAVSNLLDAIMTLSPGTCQPKQEGVVMTAVEDDTPKFTAVITLTPKCVYT
jgi:hypothetical protein